MKLKNWLLTTFIGLALLSFTASVVPQVTSFKVFDDGVFISRLLELNCSTNVTCVENLVTGKIDITVSGGVTGSGTTGVIPIWTAGTVLGDSIITELSGNIGIGTSIPAVLLEISDDSTVTAPTFGLERVDASVTSPNPIGTVAFRGGEDGTSANVASITSV